MTRELRPVTLLEARRFVAEHHRHNRPPAGWRFGVGLELDGALVGVAIAGRPIARELDDGRTLEVVRVCTLGDRNASSQLYGAACRAGAALGYRRAVTYTLESEPGSSLRAAGFVRWDPEDRRARGWARPSRPRHDATLWAEPIAPVEPRVRWRRELV